MLKLRKQAYNIINLLPEESQQSDPKSSKVTLSNSANWTAVEESVLLTIDMRRTDIDCDTVQVVVLAHVDHRVAQVHQQ